MLGAILLALLPASFLGGAFWLLYRWLQHPQLNTRRAIFVLQRDPLAAAIAAHTPEATPRGRSTAALAAAGAKGASSPAAAEGAAAEGAAAEGGGDEAPGSSEDAAAAATAAALALSSRNMAEAQARRWTFVGFSRSLFGERGLIAVPARVGCRRGGLQSACPLACTHVGAACAALCSPRPSEANSLTSLPPSAALLAGARKLPGDWCGINLDSRFVHKYGPLFEATYGQVRAWQHWRVCWRGAAAGEVQLLARCHCWCIGDATLRRGLLFVCTNA